MLRKKHVINLLFLCLAVLLFTGCTSAPAAVTPSPAPTASAVPSPSPSPIPESEKKDIPDVIGFYIKDKAAGVRRLTREYRSDWVSGEDIRCFEVFAAQKETVSGGQFGEVWRPYWNAYRDAAECKIGYSLSFTLKDGTAITKIILKPEDTEEYRSYIETYLYDDACQQPGVWYSHLEPSDVTEETVCTSIKLTAGAEIGQVEKIRLTAFLYVGATDFDSETGVYIGKKSCEVSVERQEAA